jgi:N-acetylmuramoyl-L-alanine amidase
MVVNFFASLIRWSNHQHQIHRFSRFSYSLFLAGFAVLIAAPAKAARLESWRFNASQNQLEITTDGGVQPKAQLVSDPTRLVIDLPGIILGRPVINESMSGTVRSLRIGQFDRDTTRIVIELAPGYTLEPSQIKFRGISDRRWLIKLPTPQLATSSTPAIAVVPKLSPSSRPNEIQSPRFAPAATAIAPRVMSVFNPSVFNPAVANVPMPRSPNGRVVVMIDPGHGGPDPGAVGINGLQEKMIVLDIGNQVAALLQRQGVQALLTRADDRDLDLEPRVQMAEQSNATVFVSIHANAISLSRPDINGLETYYHESGLGLAQTIHQNVLQFTGASDRGVRKARFYVLRKTSMPSVLVEVGFVTGRDDASRLSNAAYRTQMADAIARGILQYLQRAARL